MRRTSNTIASAVSLAACLTVAACGDSTAPAAGPSQPVSVSFTTAPTASSGSASASLAVSLGADALVVQRVQLVLARVELERAGGSCTSAEAAGDDSGHADDDGACAELELAPSVADVPVDGTTATALSVAIPAGSYAGFEAKVRPVETSGRRGAGSSAFLAAHPELAGVSVRVQGTFNGRAFTYTGAPQAGIESRFSPALVVDEAGAASGRNITVHADVAAWFRSPSGAVVDPASANAGGPNAGLVADNIRRSFRAFRDDDRNGHDDGDDRRGDR